MSARTEKARQRLNERFRDKLTEAVRERYAVEVEHEWQGFLSPGGGRLVTTRVDGADFTPEQYAFIGAYSEGYAAAMGELG